MTSLLCNPGGKVHVAAFIVPSHLLAQNGTEEEDPYPCDLLHGYVVENVHEHQLGNQLEQS